MLIRIGISLFFIGFCFVQTAQTTIAQDDFAALCDSWNKCNAAMTEKFKKLDEGCLLYTSPSPRD